MDDIPKPLFIGWLVCGVLGVLLGQARFPDQMKKIDSFAVLLALVVGILMGPITLYYAFTHKGADE